MVFYKSNSKKKATNLSVNEDLLHYARDKGLNLSKLLEESLIEHLRRSERDKWLVDNRKAIESYNERVERDGVFSDGLRSF